MDSSDKEILKDDLPGKKPERNAKHSEIEETKETFEEKELVCDAPVNSQVKRKSESRFENLRKRSADNVRKESDVNLTDCTNKQDTDLAAEIFTKYEKQMRPVTSPYNKQEPMEEHSKSNRIDQSTTQENNIKSSDESNSAIQEIKASIIEYLSSAIDQSESEESLENDVCTISNLILILEKLKKEMVAKQQNVTGKPMSKNVHSKNFEVYLSNKDDTKIKNENVLEKEKGADNEASKFLESDNSCAKCKQDKLGPIFSPWKRKSEEIVEDEVKRKRNADYAALEVKNEENLSNSSISQDSELHAVYTKERDNELANTMVSMDDSAKGCIKKQNLTINQTDEFTIKSKVTAGETDYETHELQTLNNESTPDQIQSGDEVVFLEDSGIRSLENSSISFVERNLLSSFLDNVKKGGIINAENEIDDSTPEDGLRDTRKDIATENLSKFRVSPENPELKLPKKREDTSVKFPSYMRNTNTNLSCDIPLKMSENSADMRKCNASNVNRSREYTHPDEPLPPQGVIAENRRNRNSGFSPVELFIDSQCDLKPIYNEPESKFINLAQMENVPEFLETRKQILESISHQCQEKSSMKTESDDEGKFPKPLEDEDPIEVGSEITQKVAFRIYALAQILANDLISECADIGLLDVPTLISRLIEIAEIHDPDIIPSIYFIINPRERARPLPEAITFDYRLARENLEKNDRAINPIAFTDNSLDKYPHNVNPLSPISSPSKNESGDKISETNFPECREYTRLAADPTNVKKDARYPKKNYKQKTPVTLSANRCRDGPSSSKIKPDIDSEENQIPSICNDPPIVSKNSDDDIHEAQSQENSKIVLNNMLKERSEDTLSAQMPTKVKQCSRYQTRLSRLKPVRIAIKCSGDAASSEIEPNIDSDTYEIQRIGDDHRILTSLQEKSEDPKILLKDNIFKEKEKCSGDKLLGTSALNFEYKISSFMEESRNSSWLNSPMKNNESQFPSILEIIPQLE